jgi:hypothetical protein
VIALAAARIGLGLAALLEPICAEQATTAVRCAQPTIWLAAAAAALIVSVVLWFGPSRKR